MSIPNYYICEHCGNMVEMVKESGVPLVCCGQKMTKIEPGTVEASFEKHIPVVNVSCNTVTVQVGAVLHPMMEAHYIEFIALVTDRGILKKELHPGDVPMATFALVDEKPLSVLAYCNLHGMWKADVE